MLYPHQWWHRLTPIAHHRIALAITAVLAFTAGLALSSPGRSALHSFVDREAALSAIAAPATNDNSVPGGNAVTTANTEADLQRAMDLYREGERALYPRTERVVPQVEVDKELQRAMDLYREGERALR